MNLFNYTNLTYLDLFSGAGGFTKGLMDAGYQFKRHYFSEIDQFASATYQYNFKHATPLGDITKIKGSTIERPNIISFGSPCQDISIAGKRKGLNGKRSGLFFEAIRLINECRPDVFIFENVKGLFSSNQGKDFEVVLQTIAHLGLYDCQWQLLNTSWFLPQNRERFYLVGILRGQARCQVFPIGTSGERHLTKNETTQQKEVIINTIDTSVGANSNRSPYIIKKDTQQYLFHQSRNVLQEIRLPENTKKGYSTAIEGDSINLSFINSNDRRGRVGKGIAKTIDTGMQQYTIKQGQLRRLTPVECERLQGFPDDWTKLGWFDGTVKEISDSQRYKMLGNAVSVPVVKAIALKLIAYQQPTKQSLNNLSNQPMDFVKKVEEELYHKRKHNKTSIEKLALGFGITDKTTVKELTELAIVNQARKLAHGGGTVKEKFDAIVTLYCSQVNISHRTSQSMLLQQYSTPAPIGYIAGVFCGIDKLDKVGGYAFEPSAGNGLLTIAAKPERVYVNELDKLRNANLKTQGFANVWNRDATQVFFDVQHTYEAVITNPPFGILDKAVMYDTFPIKMLEHLMALRALDTMSNKGRSAIIIGGHTKWDERGRIQAGKNRIFFNYLYSRYHVKDVININGSKLYSRQGTSFDVRLILIDGRKTPDLLKVSAYAPVYNPDKDVEVKTFDELFERVMGAMDEKIQMPITHPLHQVFKQYEGLKPKYPNAILFLRHHDSYVVFDKDALATTKHTDLMMTNSIMIGNQNILVTQFNASVLDNYLQQMVKAGYRVAIADELTHPSKQSDMTNLEREALLLLASFEAPPLEGLGEALNAPYEPASESCVVLQTQVPDSMAFETRTAMQFIKEQTGGDIDNFVRHRLRYPTKGHLCKVLSAEQIDAVAMAIYNIEARKQGMIIGDQTGIGKGRVAAAMIRYAVLQNVKPVFLTEKANLFSDIYRDLSAIGSGHLKPFIVNGKESKTDIKDEDGNVIYQAPPPTEQQRIIEDKTVPNTYDFVVATYSQFNSPERKPEKPNFLRAIAEDNIFILDEAHNSSGSSNTGEFLQGVAATTRGIVFLSATFAKRPDNMPIYAMKTSIADCNMSKDDLVEAITRGGVALQEILSSQLVAEGQMIRRERSFEGVEVNYLSLDVKAEEHRAIADNITEILRDIIAFQSTAIKEQIDELDKIAVAEGKEIELREGTSQAGVDNLPYFSKVFQVINQMLFSLKAEAVADQAIQRLKEGKKPVIAFASTMGSFIEQMENERGVMVSDGDTINADFTEVLRRGLDGILRYSERDVDGNLVHRKFEVSELPMEAQIEYNRIYEKIKAASTGITISPIDIIVKKIQDAGYTVAEVTGRKYEVQIDPKTNKGLVLSRKRINTNDAFRQFNNNEIDVLMINQSGSTGASAHAIATAKVPPTEVKQRVMIVLQAELDINTEVQKRGRINRTGQILKPIYDYVTSAIPAEKRLMMMLQKKLKSLDANTASNQKQSNKILDVPDFLNKYGDKIVKDYLMENKDINDLLDDPLKLKSSKADSGGSETETLEDAAHKVSGRVAVLSTKMQQDFYTEIAERYSDYVDYLKQVGDYDLEVEAMNLETETIGNRIIKMGKGSDSLFGEDSTLETVRANVLKKPFSKVELENLLTESLKGREPKIIQEELKQAYTEAIAKRLEEEQTETQSKYDELIQKIPNEKKIVKILEKQGLAAQQKAIAEREKELNEARELQVQNTEKIFNNRKQYVERILNFFYISRSLSYPIETYTGGNEFVPAVFLGFMIDTKKKNPYAPSAMKLRFAIANSSKYLAIPASYSEDIMAIIGASNDTEQPTNEELYTNWETYTKANNVDRRLRHIITGNLLQAFSDFKGKLVSYTTQDGEVRKGILMPENWNPSEQIHDKVVVPIIKATLLIKSLVQNGGISTNNGISFFKSGEYFRIIVAASKAKGGDIYLDKQLLEIVEKNNFEKTSDKMVASLHERHIDKCIEILQVNHSCSLTISTAQFNQLKDTKQRYSNRQPILLPTTQEEKTTDRDSVIILELEAEALALELELLAA
jgi:DNA-cytosine methyltransferase